jgi:hypothetical protein
LDTAIRKADAEAAAGSIAPIVEMLDLSLRRAAAAPGKGGVGARKKEEFPGIKGNMLPGNSFPQICVVSV